MNSEDSHNLRESRIGDKYTQCEGAHTAYVCHEQGLVGDVASEPNNGFLLYYLHLSTLKHAQCYVAMSRAQRTMGNPQPTTARLQHGRVRENSTLRNQCSVDSDGVCCATAGRTRIRKKRHLEYAEDSHQHDLQSISMSTSVATNVERRNNAPCTSDTVCRPSNNDANNRLSAL